MAWNEPGGGNNKPRDPWGGGDQGPPDLDEALKKLQDKLGGLFGGRGARRGGGGGAGGGSAGSAGIPGALLGVIAAGALVLWGVAGFYQVDQQERAVVLRFGKYLRYGAAWPALESPADRRRHQLNTTKVRSVSFREIMLTRDENIVEADILGAVRYR